MSALKIFEHRIQKDFNHRLKQIDGAGENMTTAQCKEALKFLETTYVGGAKAIHGELTWDRKGHEFYHKPFWVAACENNIIELAPVEYAVVSEEGGA
jgi:hypothetical protein